MTTNELELYKKIADLTKAFQVLSLAGEDIRKHAKKYRLIINAANGISVEKLFAAQHLSQFCRDFPQLIDDAIEAEMKLLEDDDKDIRWLARKGIVEFCTHRRAIIPRVADEVAKQLASESDDELNQVRDALDNLVRLNAEKAFIGILNGIVEADVRTRELRLTYAQLSLSKMGLFKLTYELEEFVIDKMKTLMPHITFGELALCIRVMDVAGLEDNSSGSCQMVDDAMAHLKRFDSPENLLTSDEKRSCVIQCARSVMPYFSTDVPSTPFVAYICDYLLPLDNFEIPANDRLQARLLSLFAELSYHCGPLENAEERMGNVYKLLLKYMTLPQRNAKNDPKIVCDFAHIENLLFVIYIMGKKQPEALTFITDTNELTEFRNRLQNLLTVTQETLDQIRASARVIQPRSERSSFITTYILMSMENIKIMSRDIFKEPPVFERILLTAWLAAKLRYRSEKVRKKKKKENRKKRIAKLKATSVPDESEEDDESEDIDDRPSTSRKALANLSKAKKDGDCEKRGGRPRKSQHPKVSSESSDSDAVDECEAAYDLMVAREEALAKLKKTKTDGRPRKSLHPNGTSEPSESEEDDESEDIYDRPSTIHRACGCRPRRSQHPKATSVPNESEKDDKKEDIDDRPSASQKASANLNKAKTDADCEKRGDRPRKSQHPKGTSEPSESEEDDESEDIDDRPSTSQKACDWRPRKSRHSKATSESSESEEDDKSEDIDDRPSTSQKALANLNKAKKDADCEKRGVRPRKNQHPKATSVPNESEEDDKSEDIDDRPSTSQKALANLNKAKKDADCEKRGGRPRKSQNDALHNKFKKNTVDGRRELRPEHIPLAIRDERKKNSDYRRFEVKPTRSSESALPYRRRRVDEYARYEWEPSRPKKATAPADDVSTDLNVPKQRRPDKKKE